MDILAVVMMIVNICVWVYMLLLFGRFVRAVECIAVKIGSSSET